MKLVPLGRSGAQVSEIALGAMYFGSAVDEETSFEMLDLYLDRGGCFLDTANNYVHWIDPFQGGESERLIGRWMHERKNRDRVFVATKIGFESKLFAAGMKPRQIRENVRRSLENLQTDVIDLLYIHRDDPETELSESFRALDALVREGAVRYLGVSNFTAPRIGQALQICAQESFAPPCCLQNRMTFLAPEPGFDTAPQVLMGADEKALCRANGLRTLAFSPLLQGAYCLPERPLPHGYDTPGNYARRKALFEKAVERGVTPNQLALAWMRAGGVIPLATGENARQLEENLGAARVETGDWMREDEA
jgi:aryl-alcohol dehydrogenase-like predicted oxidoreductase